MGVLIDVKAYCMRTQEEGLFQFNHITPTGGGIFTSEIVMPRDCPLASFITLLFRFTLVFAVGSKDFSVILWTHEPDA